MTVFFIAVAVFDGWLDGSLTFSAADDKGVQGTILCVLVAVLIVPAQLELSKIAAVKKLRIFNGIAITASVLLTTSWYWPQVAAISPVIYLSLVLAFTLFSLMLYQYLRYGISGTIANCGANYFSIIYLGVLSGFVVAIRVKFGVWYLLMFVFVVKSADIGAYTAGRLFGRHKFSPGISPGKTWEGMGGAVAAAMIVAVLFAVCCDIIKFDGWVAALFGFCFAFVGQFGDLAESMIKRDARQKDSANNVPGFGGILDIIDSPLAAAAPAYLFFMCGSL